MPIVSTVRAILGCPEPVAILVTARMKASPGRPPDQLERLAWSAFAAFRRDRLRAGCDDPLWDLAVTTPPEGS